MIGKFLLSAAMAALVAASVQATPQTIKFTGTVAPPMDEGYGVDTFGLFGEVGADLTGAAFTVIYKFDNAVGTVDTGDGWQTVSGGSQNDTVGPALYSTQVTINGRSVFIGKSFYSTLTSATVGDYAGSLYSVNAQDNSGGIGRSIFTSISQSGVQPWGNPNFVTFDGDVSDSSWPGSSVFAQWDSSTQQWDYLSLNTQHLTITNGVPEPSSWAMMLGGFGLVGGAMRRRRARVGFA